MPTDMHWRIRVKDLETQVRIGIYDHELVPQRIIVNATVEAHYTSHPQSIDDCVSYETIYQLVAKEWPNREHVELLESYVIELLNHIFHIDSRVSYAKVAIGKPDIYPEAKSVGVEAEWSRADFERHNKI